MQDFTLYNGLLSKLSKKDLNDLFIYLQNYKLKRRDSLNFSDYYSFGIEVEFERLALEEAKRKIESIKDFKYWLVHEEKSVQEIIDGESIGVKYQHLFFITLKKIGKSYLDYTKF